MIENIGRGMQDSGEIFQVSLSYQVQMPNCRSLTTYFAEFPPAKLVAEVVNSHDIGLRKLRDLSTYSPNSILDLAFDRLDSEQDFQSRTLVRESLLSGRQLSVAVAEERAKSFNDRVAYFHQKVWMVCEFFIMAFFVAVPGLKEKSIFLKLSRSLEGLLRSS
jgi:hypothetical protein